MKLKITEAAIEAAGGVEAVASEFNISRQAVEKWKKIPVLRVKRISEITNIPREVLRPDVFN